MIEDLEPIGFFSPWFLKILIGRTIYSIKLTKHIGIHMKTDTVIYASSA